MFFYGDLNVTQVLGICAFSLFLCYVIYKWIQSKNYPPGPIGLPFLGYWPFLGNFPPHTLLKLSKKYGDIFSFYIGSKRMICVTDYRMAKEILSHQLTLARPPKSFDFLKGKAGFGGLNGDEWQEQRRFALLTMRNLGMGKGLWETMIQVFINFTTLLKAWGMFSPKIWFLVAATANVSPYFRYSVKTFLRFLFSKSEKWFNRIVEI